MNRRILRRLLYSRAQSHLWYLAAIYQRWRCRHGCAAMRKRKNVNKKRIVLYCINMYVHVSAVRYRCTIGVISRYDKIRFGDVVECRYSTMAHGKRIQFVQLKNLGGIHLLADITQLFKRVPEEGIQFQSQFVRFVTSRGTHHFVINLRYYLQGEARLFSELSYYFFQILQLLVIPANNRSLCFCVSSFRQKQLTHAHIICNSARGNEMPHYSLFQIITTFCQQKSTLCRTRRLLG